MEPEIATVIRETDQAAKAGDWSLVLASAGIAHQLRESPEMAGPPHLQLIVETGDVVSAARALDEFDAEARAEGAAQLAAMEESKSALGLAISLLLLAFYLVAGPREVPAPTRWFEVGSASAERILRGQWWRAVTAMTLHADLLHLFGNVAAALIFVSAVGRWLGPGLGAAAILCAGAAGNLLTAMAHRTGHVSVGASTATFAALGIMAGLGVVRRYRHLPQRRSAWVPIGAGLGLFAMLGVGEHTDVLAHLFGLAAGCALGIVLAATILRRAGAIAQVTLALGAAAALAGCWLLAFRG
jgi:rhomboid protease GluP